MKQLKFRGRSQYNLNANALQPISRFASNASIIVGIPYGTSNTLLVSNDYENWTKVTPVIQANTETISAASVGNTYSLIWSGKAFLLGTSNGVWSSIDGYTWTGLTNIMSNAFDIAASTDGNDIVVINSSATTIKGAVSHDGGSTWKAIRNEQLQIQGTRFSSVTYDPIKKKFWILDVSGNLYHSARGDSWLSILTPLGDTPSGKFIATGYYLNGLKMVAAYDGVAVGFNNYNTTTSSPTNTYWRDGVYTQDDGKTLCPIIHTKFSPSPSVSYYQGTYNYDSSNIIFAQQTTVIHDGSQFLTIDMEGRVYGSKKGNSWYSLELSPLNFIIDANIQANAASTTSGSSYGSNPFGPYYTLHYDDVRRCLVTCSSSGVITVWEAKKGGAKVLSAVHAAGAGTRDGLSLPAAVPAVTPSTFSDKIATNGKGTIITIDASSIIRTSFDYGETYSLQAITSFPLPSFFTTATITPVQVIWDDYKFILIAAVTNTLVLYTSNDGYSWHLNTEFRTYISTGTFDANARIAQNDDTIVIVTSTASIILRKTKTTDVFLPITVDPIHPLGTKNADQSYVGYGTPASLAFRLQPTQFSVKTSTFIASGSAGGFNLIVSNTADLSETLLLNYVVGKTIYGTGMQTDTFVSSVSKQDEIITITLSKAMNAASADATYTIPLEYIEVTSNPGFNFIFNTLPLDIVGTNVPTNTKIIEQTVHSGILKLNQVLETAITSIAVLTELLLVTDLDSHTSMLDFNVAFDMIKPGDFIVSGTGITAGTRVVSIDKQNHLITLDKKTTAAVSSSLSINILGYQSETINIVKWIPDINKFVFTGNYTFLTYNDSGYAGNSVTPSIFESSDGAFWTFKSRIIEGVPSAQYPQSVQFPDFDYNDGKFYFITTNVNRIVYATSDFINWEQKPIPASLPHPTVPTLSVTLGNGARLYGIWKNPDTKRFYLFGQNISAKDRQLINATYDTGSYATYRTEYRNWTTSAGIFSTTDFENFDYETIPLWAIGTIIFSGAVPYKNANGKWEALVKKSTTTAALSFLVGIFGEEENVYAPSKFYNGINVSYGKYPNYMAANAGSFYRNVFYSVIWIPQTSKWLAGTSDGFYESDDAITWHYKGPTTSYVSTVYTTTTNDRIYDIKMFNNVLYAVGEQQSLTAANGRYKFYMSTDFGNSWSVGMFPDARYKIEGYNDPDLGVSPKLIAAPATAGASIACRIWNGIDWATTISTGYTYDFAFGKPANSTLTPKFVYVGASTNTVSSRYCVITEQAYDSSTTIQAFADSGVTASYLATVSWLPGVQRFIAGSNTGFIVVSTGDGTWTKIARPSHCFNGIIVEIFEIEDYVVLLYANQAEVTVIHRDDILNPAMWRNANTIGRNSGKKSFGIPGSWVTTLYAERYSNVSKKSSNEVVIVTEGGSYGKFEMVDDPELPTNVVQVGQALAGQQIRINYGASAPGSVPIWAYSLEARYDSANSSLNSLVPLWTPVELRKVEDDSSIESSFVVTVPKAVSIVEYRVTAIDELGNVSLPNVVTASSVVSDVIPLIDISGSSDLGTFGNEDAGEVKFTWSARDPIDLGENYDPAQVVTTTGIVKAQYYLNSELIETITLNTTLNTATAPLVFDLSQFGNKWNKLKSSSHTITLAVTNRRGTVSYATKTFTKKFDTIFVKLHDPIYADTRPTHTQLDVVADYPVSANVDVYVTNNGFDQNPTWENVTQSIKDDEIYTFTNTTKTADQWGFDVKVEVDRNDASGPIWIADVSGRFI